jgi:hypothetical protein
MKHRYVILAAKDISKSNFAQAEEIIAAKHASGRSLALDDAEEASPALQAKSHSATRCLKFVLCREGTTQNTEAELICAFEYLGHIKLPSPTPGCPAPFADLSWLEGSVLEISTQTLEVARGVLLLKAGECCINAPQTTTTLPSDFSFCDEDDLEALLRDDISVL